VGALVRKGEASPLRVATGSDAKLGSKARRRRSPRPSERRGNPSGLPSSASGGSTTELGRWTARRDENEMFTAALGLFGTTGKSWPFFPDECSLEFWEGQDRRPTTRWSQNGGWALDASELRMTLLREAIMVLLSPTGPHPGREPRLWQVLFHNVQEAQRQIELTEFTTWDPRRDRRAARVFLKEHDWLFHAAKTECRLSPTAQGHAQPGRLNHPQKAKAQGHWAAFQDLVKAKEIQEAMGALTGWHHGLCHSRCENDSTSQEQPAGMEL